MNLVKGVTNYPLLGEVKEWGLLGIFTIGGLREHNLTSTLSTEYHRPETSRTL